MAYLRLCVLALMLSMAAASAVPITVPPQFDFYEFFVGEWDVQRSTVALKSFDQTRDDLMGHYSINKQNGSTHLIGRSFDNDTVTGEKTSHADIFVEMQGRNAGTFKVGSSEDDLKTLFHFDFTPQNNGLMISHGEWHGSSGGHYQFAYGALDRFLITVTPNDKAQPLVLFTGRKIPEVREKTFFQAYGTWLMLGGFFLFQMFMQNKTRQMQANQAGAPAAGPRVRGAANERPTVEEAAGPESKKSS